MIQDIKTIEKKILDGSIQNDMFVEMLSKPEMSAVITDFSTALISMIDDGLFNKEQKMSEKMGGLKIEISDGLEKYGIKNEVDAYRHLKASILLYSFLSLMKSPEISNLDKKKKTSSEIAQEIFDKKFKK
jgi:hypothetical protein